MPNNMIEEEEIDQEEDIEIVSDDLGVDADDEKSVEEEKTIVEEEEEEEGEEREEEESLSEEERRAYGRRAKKRIQGLVSKLSQERVARETLAKEFEELRKQVSEVNKNVSSIGKTSSENAFKDAVANLDREISEAKEAYRKSFNEGNFEESGEATQKLIIASIKRSNLESAQRIRESISKQPNNEARQSEGEAAQPRQQAPAVTATAKRWRKENDEWLGKDRILSVAAATIAEDLSSEGYNPYDENDEDFGTKAFFDEIDKRLRREFPNKFSREKVVQRQKQKTMGTSRVPTNSSSGKVQVKLTAGEKAIADELGISYIDYAREKIKEERKAGQF